MFGMSGHMILKSFRREKPNSRGAVLSGDRSYLSRTQYTYMLIFFVQGSV